ncbi:MAG: PEP/pyruvate-binding domain-containing protein [bacterium]
MAEAELNDYHPKRAKFDALMQFKARRILLVSSAYDSYVLEEDGQLTDLIYNEYLELNLSVTPHVKRAATANEAIQTVKAKDFDLVIVFKRVSDIDVAEFAYQVKQIRPDLPVIFLAYHQREIAVASEHEHASAIDHAFVWTGDVLIMLAIIKLVEDAVNVDADARLVGVRVIIVVEDNVKFYSSFLPLLYAEIMVQTRALMAEGLNITDKLSRMKARPKILLATTYEDGVRLFEKYRKYTLALITDFRYLKGGQRDDEAGLKLVQHVREFSDDLPILMESSDLDNANTAFANNVGFIHKRSPTLHEDIRQFIRSHFGFGDFVFTLPDGTVVATAQDFRAMEKVLETVDARSLVFHAQRNHFSNWLMARTEFDLAAQVRPRKVSEFGDVQKLRSYLIDTIRCFRHERQLGVVSDFSARQFDLESDFVRIGGGSLGGKGRGLAFINALFNKYDLTNQFKGVKLSVPHSVIVGTDVFDAFIRSNDLIDCALGIYSDQEITDRFLKATFPRRTQVDLLTLLGYVDYPLAVRSSSMLEDSHLEPAAGIYDTHMLINSHADIKVRQRQLIRAIKLIYASTFFGNARTYQETVGNRVEEEKMAVIIQQAVGSFHDEAFYPSFSGVALSYNYYSMDGIPPADGVVYVAMGLGKTIVDGLNCLRFSPTYPEKLPQFSTTKDMLKNSQHEFYAIGTANPGVLPQPGGEAGLLKLGLRDAERHDTISALCSTYSPDNDRVYDGCSREGARILTFAPILKHNQFPLSEIARYLLKLGSEGLNCPVEIEFAVNLFPASERPSEFHFLQVRPMIKDAVFETVSLDDIPGERVVIKSENALGNMADASIEDIVLVDPSKFDRRYTVAIAEQVGHLNQILKAGNRKFLLIGPGRWGTSERWLGVPVAWNQISNAKVIVEAAYGEFAPDPSFGTHFFHNLTSFRMGYLTVNAATGNGFLDWDWLLAQELANQTEFVKHFKLKQPIEILLDGREGSGLILKSQ